jgi:hypothetical protein
MWPTAGGRRRCGAKPGHSSVDDDRVLQRQAIVSVRVQFFLHMILVSFHFRRQSSNVIGQKPLRLGPIRHLGFHQRVGFCPVTVEKRRVKAPHVAEDRASSFRHAPWSVSKTNTLHWMDRHDQVDHLLLQCGQAFIAMVVHVRDVMG